MELYVFDRNLNRLGMIDDFIQLKVEPHYRKMGQLNMIVDGEKDNLDLLQKGRILAKADDLQHGYLILTRDYLDEKSSELVIIAPSINTLLSRRLLYGQQSFSGQIENVMKSFVLVNAVNPINPNRKIPNLFISNNTNISINTEEGGTGKQLDEFLYGVANKHDVSWSILMDVQNKRFIFDVWQGTDRSAEQSINPRVIFSKDRENVLRQNYIESDSDYKNVALVAGEGEGADRTYITVNDEVSGWDRVELFVDARDLQSTYRSEDGEEIAMPIGEYQELVKQRGKSKLAEHPRIVTFESDIDLYANGVYGQDYFLGDKVSVVNEDLGIIMHTRITSAIEITDRQGTSLQVGFGSNIPTLLDKLKRAVK
ncbi:siphovirus ReqiPepy6 Gp37-like family protein [Anaerobacillus isosaccharinicus]|uniref:Siphovirus ReqiPepy6 Gp37-like family protein n=1 Tax=Anaerobacillus isosaccharinicus TaxID=1532552 RepID=A0A1S2L9H6_9BACI|nr:siphovirus ReqiPepy6 Gp37-like family protein [Anaerobacillus isosaccharinicus]MBA5584581.1 siphovirus ReqiPepy6 Gp37-like family protein [Anaerobacillus isosaccharinicus]QOY37039.1 siphovirus ReqiPepy6 Gp37-like family protein [Anaerobacillus isosaccharinicus]